MKSPPNQFSTVEALLIAGGQSQNRQSSINWEERREETSKKGEKLGNP